MYEFRRETRILEAETSVEDIDGFVESLGEIGERHGVVIQGFDPEYVVSRRHIEEAVAKTERAFERGENVARKRSIEFLLYVAGTRQIDVATEMGVKEGETTSVIAVYPRDDGDVDGALESTVSSRFVESAETWDGSGSDVEVVREFFGIGDDEIEAVGDSKLELLVLERVALLDVNK